MAKISQLVLKPAPTGTELIPILDKDGATKAATLNGLVSAALPACRPFPGDGALLAGGMWLSGNAPEVVEANDPVLRRFGLSRAAIIPAGLQYHFEGRVPAGFGKGSSIAISFMVVNAAAVDWPDIGPGGFRALLNYEGPDQQVLDFAFEDIDPGHRRYHTVIRSTLAEDLKSFLIEITASSVVLKVTGFLVTGSPRSIGDVDYLDLSTQRPSDQPDPNIPRAGRSVNGNLAAGDPVLAFGTVNVIPIVYPPVVARGVNRGMRIGAGDPPIFWSPKMPKCPAGNWVVRSVFLLKEGYGPWPTGTDLRVILYENDDFTGASQSVSFDQGEFEQIDPALRRYRVSFQAGITADRAILQVSGAPADTRYTAFGITENEFGYEVRDLDWRDWDPGQQHVQNVRLDEIEQQLGGIVNQADPDLLVASSYDVIAGRPLVLHRDGLSGHREELNFEVTAIGRNGDRVGISTASPLITLTAETFSGPALIRAKRKDVDDMSAWGADVTIHTAPAIKATSPKVLLFGDSLPYQYQVAELARKAKAVGMAPTFLGTYPAHGNYDGSAAPGDPAFIPAEARSSFQAVNVDYRVRRTQSEGTFYDLFPVRDDGGDGAVFAATLAGGVVTGVRITAAGANYPDGRIPLLFDSPPTADANRRALAWVTFTGGEATAVELEFGGSGYGATANVGLIPTIAQYLAMPATNDFDARWRFLPWLRLATSADAPAKVHNGYVVDITYYLARLGMPIPDCIIIGWETNDIRNGTPTADTLASLIAFRDACRAAAPNAHVLFTVNGMGERSSLWVGVRSVWKAMFPVFANKEADRVWLRPLFQTMDPKLVYGTTTAAIDPTTGIRTLFILDSVHPLRIGASLAAEMLIAWIAARMNA